MAKRPKPQRPAREANRRATGHDAGVVEGGGPESPGFDDLGPTAQRRADGWAREEPEIVEPQARTAFRGRPDSRRAVVAVGYLRRSTDRQEQSIPDQKKVVEDYCAEHDLKLMRCYVDDAISGTSTVGRKAFQQMMSDAQRPECAFGVVVCYDVKRFGRVDNDEAGYYRHVLKTHGVEVAYASENFTGDYTDDLLRPVKQWQARQESKDLSKVTIRGLMSKSGTGQWMGGAPPFGFDLRYESQAGQFLFYLRYMPDGRKQMFNQKWKLVRTLERGESVAVSRKDHCNLIPSDPKRVEIVRRIYRMYIEEGRGFKAIADVFNREKVPPARGPGWAEHYSGQWAMTTVRAILINPAYCGDMVWNRRTDARFHRIKEGVASERKDVRARRLENNHPTDWTVVRDAHPAILPRRTWEMARQMIEAKPASESQRGVDQRSGTAAGGDREFRTVGGVGGWTGPRSRFLLSKLVTCARCGSRYEGYTMRSSKAAADGERVKTYYYACGGYIRRGKSVCDLGEVPQLKFEDAVIRAVVGYYQRYTGEDGKLVLGTEIRKLLGVEGDEVGQTQEKLKKQLDKLDATTRRLLDNITPANTAAVERRLREIDVERVTVAAKLEALERVGLSKAEVRDLIHETSGFISGLEARLREGPLGNRQAALRRCVGEVRFKQRSGAVARVLTVPVAARESSGNDWVAVHLEHLD